MGELIIQNDLQNEIRDIFSDLILSWPDPESEEENEKMILDLYQFHPVDGVPDFCHIVEEVYSHNLELSYRAAITEADHGWDMEKLSEDEQEDIIGELSNNWEEYNSMNGLTGQMSEYVEYVLIKHKMAHSIDPDDEPYWGRSIGNYKFWKNEKIKIIANDCQNLVFPELIMNFCMGAEGCVTYHNIEIVNENLRRLT